MTSPLWMRLAVARQGLAPVRSRYRVVFEDPADPDAPAKVLVPDPNWMAAALAGGVLSPLGCHLRDLQREPGEPAEHPHADPIGPMSEEQAIEYLFMTAVPRRVWDAPGGNRPLFCIATVDQVPAERHFRNAWRLAA